jgi:ATP-binding protein involved in chromosome partitioning
MNQEAVLEALKKVFYFPKRDNVVSLDMIRNIKIEGDTVSFTLLFPEKDEKNETIVRDACINAVREAAGNDTRVVVDVGIPVNMLENVKHIVAVASGKGGVGKSTIAANLAIALQKSGFKTGIIDADIYGPSIPMMFDLVDTKPAVMEMGGKSLIVPPEQYGIKVLSIGFFVDQNQALIWRGPMASNALQQLFRDTDWGELDYLVVDLPPGTGDIQLTLAQEINVSGVIIVSTPQEVALADARKAFSMFNQEKIRIPVLGLVENMAYFTPEELPDNKYYIFGKEGGRKLAEKSNVPFLGQIPLVQGVCEAGDRGIPSALEDESIISKAFMELAKNVKNELTKLDLQ